MKIDIFNAEEKYDILYTDPPWQQGRGGKKAARPNSTGTTVLVSRKLPGAVIKDKDLAIKRVVRMVKEGKVESINGNDISIKADSICVHGDNPKALEFVKNIRETLVAEGVEIKNLFR